MHLCGLWHEGGDRHRENMHVQGPSQDFNQKSCSSVLLYCRVCVCVKAPFALCSLHAPYMITPLLFYHFTVLRFLSDPSKTNKRWAHRQFLTVSRSP